MFCQRAAEINDGDLIIVKENGAFALYLYLKDRKVKADGEKRILHLSLIHISAQFALSEQFSLKPGGTYYFDLSAMDIPGTANSEMCIRDRARDCAVRPLELHVIVRRFAL